jgi:hypothetical protein
MAASELANASFVLSREGYGYRESLLPPRGYASNHQYFFKRRLVVEASSPLEAICGGLLHLTKRLIRKGRKGCPATSRTKSKSKPT